MKVYEFEDKIVEIEGVLIRVEASSDEAVVDDYGYQEEAPGDWRADQWLEERVYPRLRSHGIDKVTLIHGETTLVEDFGQVTLDELRNSSGLQDTL